MKQVFTILGKENSAKNFVFVLNTTGKSPSDAIKNFKKAWLSWPEENKNMWSGNFKVCWPGYKTKQFKVGK